MIHTNYQIPIRDLFEIVMIHSSHMVTWLYTWNDSDFISIHIDLNKSTLASNDIKKRALNNKIDVGQKPIHIFSSLFTLNTWFEILKGHF